jgi:hypothetical protein
LSSAVDKIFALMKSKLLSKKKTPFLTKNFPADLLKFCQECVIIFVIVQGVVYYYSPDLNRITGGFINGRHTEAL